MTVVFGIVNRSGGSLNKEYVSAMKFSATMDGQRRIAVREGENYLFGYFDVDGERIRYAEDERIVFLMGGEYFDITEPIVSRRVGESANIHPPLRMTRFLSPQVDYNAVRLLDGAFACVWYDEAQQELHFLNDALGLHPLFYVEMGDYVAFASEYQILMGLPFDARFVDHEGINEYLTYGLFVDGKTPIIGLRNLTGAEHRVWSRLGMSSVTTYEDWKYEIDPSITFPEALSMVYEHMSTAISRKLLDGKVKFIPITGGMDTRVLFNLVPQDIREQFMWQTNLSPFLTEETDKDVIIAKQITSKFGLRHEIWQTPMALEENPHDGAYFFEITRPTKQWYNINGHFPNYLRDMFFRPEKIEQKPLMDFRGFYNRGSLDSGKGVNTLSSRQRDSDSKNSPYFRYFLQKCTSILDDHPMNSGTWVNPTSLHLRCLRTPCTDASLYRLLLTLPRDYLAEGKMYLHLMRHENPEVFRIPFVYNHFPRLKDDILSELTVADFGQDYQHHRKRTWEYCLRKYITSPQILGSKQYGNVFLGKICLKYVAEYSFLSKFCKPVRQHWRYREYMPSVHPFIKLESWLRAYL